MGRREASGEGGREGRGGIENVLIVVETVVGRQAGRQAGREGGRACLPRVCSNGSKHARDRAHGVEGANSRADGEGEEGGLADCVERGADGQEGGEGDEIQVVVEEGERRVVGVLSRYLREGGRKGGKEGRREGDRKGGRQ